MKTVVLGEPPPALTSLIAERQRLGLDTHDEVWNGEYHLAPAPSYEHAHSGAKLARLLGDAADVHGYTVSIEFNLGEPDNFRVPDFGVHRGQPEGLWIPTAAIVVEVRSPDDESYEKFGHYFEHDVDEILIADLVTEAVTWFVRSDDGFVPGDASALLKLSSRVVAQTLGWPIAGEPV
jgi:Uma2 family endonuclease